MKKIITAGLGLLLFVGVAGMAFAAETSVTGELRDSFCYLTMGAHGPRHHKCAVECAEKGIPVMLQTADNKFYVLLPPKNAESLPKSVIDKMEEKVTVTGDEYSKGGMTFLTVKSVK